MRTCSNGLPLGAPAGHSVGVDVMKTHARITCACHAITVLELSPPLPTYTITPSLELVDSHQSCCVHTSHMLMPFQPCRGGDIFMSWERGQHVRLSIWAVSLGVECMPKLVSVFHSPLQSDLHVLKCGDDTAYLAPPCQKFHGNTLPLPNERGQQPALLS